MKLLIIDKPVKLDIKQSTIRVDMQKIPLHLIDTIILIGKHQIETNLLINLTKFGITILFLNRNFIQSAITIPSKSKNAELKLKQYQAISSAKMTLKIAKYIIKNKIQSHITQLKEHNIQIEYNQHQIENSQDIDTLLGIEGSFAKEYFKHFFTLLPKTLHSSKRTKQPPLDPVNALLSLYYTMFYNIITIRLISFGFEPSLGFLHKPFRSHNALSSDIIEFIRADINEFVYTLFKNKIVSNQDFTKKDGVYLKYQSRKKLWKEFQDFNNKLTPKIDTIIANIRSML